MSYAKHAGMATPPSNNEDSSTKMMSYLKMYACFVGYSLLFLQPFLVICSLIEHGWTMDALDQILALLVVSVIFAIIMPLVIVVLMAIYVGILHFLSGL